MKLLGVLIIGLVMVFAFTALQDVRADEADEAFKAGQKYISKTLLTGDKGIINSKLVFGYRYKADLLKLRGYSKQDDNVAVKRATAKLWDLDHVTIFNRGTVVYCVDTDYSSDMVKVRMKGRTEEYWIKSNCVSKQ